MTKDNEKYQAYVQILNEELIPAMGCTGTDCAGLCGCKGKRSTGMSAGQSHVSEQAEVSLRM